VWGHLGNGVFYHDCLRMKIRKCKTCTSPLKEIGTIEPDTNWVSTKSPALSPLDGAEYLVVFMLAPVILVPDLFQGDVVVAASSIAVFGGIGCYFWQRPRKFYSCPKCNVRYYGASLKRYSD